MRECVAPLTIGGVTITPQTNNLVFVSHGAAMRDPTVISEPLKISTTRDAGDRKYGPQRTPDLLMHRRARSISNTVSDVTNVLAATRQR